MSDLISRQAAIDAISEKSDEIYKTKQKGATYPHDDFFQGMAYAENIVKQLPSAQPEPPQWIPCSERLPDNDTYVLISKNPHPLTGEKWCVTIAARFADGRSREIQWRDIGFGMLRDVEVIAWMPLPECYRGENDG